MYMQEHTRRAYRKMLAWLGFAFLWLLMPAIIIWALINLVSGTSTYDRTAIDANSEAHLGALDAPLSAEAPTL